MSDGRPEVRFMVGVTPRAAAQTIDGVRDGVLRVRIAAPALDGAANRALVRLVAGELRVAPSSVRIVRGAAGRSKLVAVTGVETATVTARWPGLALDLRGRER